MSDELKPCPFNIGDKVKHVDVGNGNVPGGRIVINLAGQSVPYSAAYNYYIGLQKYHPTMWPTRIRAADKIGLRKHHDEHAIKYDSSKGLIHIGCQKISVRALYALAEREGW